MKKQIDEKTANALARSEDFRTRYANDAWLEPSAWDLNLVFGTITQDTSAQHTAVTLPWGMVKILAYRLAASVAFFEAQHGAIQIPSAVVPPQPNLPNEDGAEPSTYELALLEYAQTLYRFFFARRQNAPAVHSNESVN